MKDNDSFGPRRDQSFDLGLVEIKSIWPDVAEDGDGAPEHLRIHRGDEGKGRHNNLVSFSEIQQKSGHFERGGTRGRQQNPRRAEFTFQKRLTLLVNAPSPEMCIASRASICSAIRFPPNRVG